MNIIGFDEPRVQEKDSNLHVVDPNTQKVVNYIHKGDKIVRQSSIESFKKLKDKEAEGVCEEWKVKDFNKINAKELQLVMSELTQFEKTFLFSILPYIVFDSNSLQIKKDKKLIDIGTEELIRITGMARSTMYDVIKSLQDKDIIYKGRNSKNTQYYVNPWLFCKGNRINKVLKNMFKNYKVRSHNGITWNEFDENSAGD